jgi:hypothetical protein
VPGAQQRLLGFAKFQAAHNYCGGAGSRDQRPSKSASPFQGDGSMATVYILARPRGYPEGSPIIDYVVEDGDDNVLIAFNTLPDAVKWAKELSYTPLVAHVRSLADKMKPDQWREA